jgi:hypothetical protein
MAANKQAGAATYAADLQKQMFDQTVANEKPFLDSGIGANSRLSYLLGLPGATGTPGPNGTNGYGSLLSNFTADTFHQLSPAYQFARQQGQQGVLNGNASGAGALSGAAQKDLMSYNTGNANSAFNNAFNQWNTQQSNIYARLAGVANTGQSAASNTATGGSSYANSIGQQTANAGTASAGGIVGAANSLGSAAAAMPWLMQGQGNYATDYSAMPTSLPSADAYTQTTTPTVWTPSDRRLKFDIRSVGALPSGLTLYLFRYLSTPDDQWVGVMADEAVQRFPHAVRVGDDGFSRVNYAEIH